MIRTETAATSPKVKRGPGPRSTRRRRPQQRPNHERNERARHAVGKALDRRAASLRFGNHLHDLREHGLAATFSAHDEAAALVHGAADNLWPGPWKRAWTRRHHRFVDRAAAFHHLAIDGDGFSWPHAQAITGRHQFERHSCSVPSGSTRRACFGARFKKPDRAAGPGACPKLRTCPSRTSTVMTEAASK